MKTGKALFGAVSCILFLAVAGMSTGDCSGGFEPVGTQLTFSEGEKWFTDMSPDGELITYSEQGPSGEYDIWVVPASGGEPTNLTQSIDGNCVFPSFTADSGEVTFTSHGTEMWNVTTWTIKSIDIETMSVRDIRTNATNGFWSHDGGYLVYRRGDSAELVVYDELNDADTVIAPGDERGGGGFWYAVPAFDGDDSHVVTSVIDDADGMHKIYAIPSTGGQFGKITGASGYHWYPDCSSDGEWILYSNFIFGFDAGGHTAYAELWVYNTLTGEEMPVFPDAPDKSYCGSFSPDGSAFSYVIENQVYIADFPFESRVIPALQLMIEQVKGWSADGVIKGGIAKSLVKQLENVIAKLEKGKINPAINKLEAFINHVEALSGKKIPEELAAELIADAGSIIGVLSHRQSAVGKSALSQQISVEESETLPDGIPLLHNTPNPFNPSTTISYSIANTGWANLIVYDLLGRKVATLADGAMTPGEYSVTWNAEGFSSGVYFCRLEHDGGKILTHKMLLVK